MHNNRFMQQHITSILASFSDRNQLKKKKLNRMWTSATFTFFFHSTNLTETLTDNLTFEVNGAIAERRFEKL